jgi:glucokinase
VPGTADSGGGCVTGSTPAVLVGDVGATNLRLALVDRATAARLRELTAPSRSCSGLVEPALTMLRDASCPVRGAVFAVAGPVVEGRAELTNLGWSLEEAGLAAELGLESVHLVNDMVALGHAIPALGPDAMRTLQAGRPVDGGTIAVVAPGTGLGEAFLTWEDAGYRVHATEGGHADFAPLDARQEQLLRWLRLQVGHVSTERVCSGRALASLYAFMRDEGGVPESPAVAQRIARADDPTPVIIAAAVASPPCLLAAAAVNLLAEILMAEAGNMALRTLALGGVYLAGGLPRRLVGILERPEIRAQFGNKGRLSDLLERVPLRVVLQANVGLVGAIRYALSESPAKPAPGVVA